MKLNIHHYASLYSTQDSAKHFVLDGSGEGTVIIADEQDGGRGRQDRPWYSLKGNIHSSVVLNPKTHLEKEDNIFYGQLSLMTALAVLKGLRNLFPEVDDLRIKWPNDGIYNGKKVFGVLLECFDHDTVIIGIGINVNTLPDEVKDNAIHLKSILQKEDDLDLQPIFHSILKELFQMYKIWIRDGFESFRSEWESYCPQIGTFIERSCDVEKQLQKGKFIGLNDDGSMLLEKEDGSHLSIYTI